MIKNSILLEADEILTKSIVQKQSFTYKYASSQDQCADTIFFGGHIYTMKYNSVQQENHITYLAIKNGIILHIGTEQSYQKWVGPHTQIIDLKQKTLLPGFIDPHIHFVYAGLGHWINLSPFVRKDMQSVWCAVLEAVKNAKPNQWIMCYGYDTIITPGQKLDLSISKLDQVSDKIPIFIMQSNGHIAHANTAAFTLSNISKDTPDPPHSRFVKDQNGNLTGQIQQVPAINVIQYHSPPLSASQYAQNTKKFFQLASSKGCTSLHDCGIGAYDPKLDYKIIKAVTNQDPCVRFSGFLVAHAQKYWDSLQIKPENKDPYLRINGIKFWVDGSLQAGSGFLRQPYLGLFNGKGNPNYPQTMLNDLVLKFHQRDWQIGIHANGDAAIDMAIDSLQYAKQKCKQNTKRHRIQHCTVSNNQQFQRMKQIGIVPSFLIGHVYYYGEYFQNKLLGQARKIDSCRMALDKGLKISLHSDYLSQPIDPLRCIYNAVTRKSYISQKIINPEQRISIYQALRAMTIDAAWQCHTEDIVGSLQIGKYADLVVIDRDILNIPKQEILQIKVKQTWLAGRMRYKNRQ